MIETGARRREIDEVASELFHANGYAATSVRDIARDLDMGLDEGGEPLDGVRIAGLIHGSVRRVLERRGRPIDDRPEEVLLRGDVGVQARALDVDRPGDVAHARPRVAALVEERAGGSLDLASAGGFDQQAPRFLTNAC